MKRRRRDARRVLAWETDHKGGAETVRVIIIIVPERKKRAWINTNNNN
jgi:hypothetical protein